MKDTTEDIARTLAATRRGKGRRIWMWLAVLLLAGLGGWGWYATRQTGDSISYTTQPVTRGALTVTVTATGTVQPTTEVEVSSELSGTLATVSVDYNDEVKAGQELAQLDTTKIKAQLANAEATVLAATASVADAEATAKEALANYNARDALAQRGVTTQKDLVADLASHQRAEAKLQIAKADLTVAQANLAVQQADLEKATIRSPINGIVLDRAAEVGQIVASSLNAPVLFTLAEDLAHMQLQVDIDEADIGRIAAGNPATFTVEAYGARSFPANVAQVRFAPETTDGVVTYKAVLTVENTERLLRPGMTATATITVAEAKDALLVPNAALRFAPPSTTTAQRRSGSGLLGLIMPRRPSSANGNSAKAGKSVWVLQGGAPVEVPVTLGDSDGTFTIVTAEGLAEGDEVITDQATAK